MKRNIIELKDVTTNFKNEKTQKPFFQNFNFKLKEGEKIGIIGETGSGKSLLAKTIFGLYSYKEGEIIIQNKVLEKNINCQNTKKCDWIYESGEYIFQNPLAIFGKTRKVKEIIYLPIKNFDKLQKHLQEELISYKKNLNRYNQQFLFKREKSTLDEFIILFRKEIFKETKSFLKNDNLSFQEYLFNYESYQKYNKELEQITFKLLQEQKRISIFKKENKEEEISNLIEIHSANISNFKNLKQYFHTFKKFNSSSKEEERQDFEKLFASFFDEIVKQNLLSEIFFLEENLPWEDVIKKLIKMFADKIIINEKRRNSSPFFLYNYYYVLLSLIEKFSQEEGFFASQIWWDFIENLFQMIKKNHHYFEVFKNDAKVKLALLQEKPRSKTSEATEYFYYEEDTLKQTIVFLTNFETLYFEFLKEVNITLKSIDEKTLKIFNKKIKTFMKKNFKNKIAFNNWIFLYKRKSFLKENKIKQENYKKTLSLLKDLIENFVINSPEEEIMENYEFVFNEVAKEKMDTWLNSIEDENLLKTISTLKVKISNTEKLLQEPKSQKKFYDQKVEEMFDALKLPIEVLNKYPQELSGGEQQKVLLIRSLLLEPKFIIADEITSSLDLISQNELEKLFQKLFHFKQTSLIFISNNLAFLNALTQRIVVLHNGKIIEDGKTSEILNNPLHPITKKIVSDLIKGDNLEDKEIIWEETCETPFTEYDFKEINKEHFVLQRKVREK